MRLRARTSSSLQCPYCHTEAEVEEQVLACQDCNAVFHTACVEEALQRCPTLGCDADLTPAAVIKAPRWWIRPAAVLGLIAGGIGAVALGSSVSNTTAKFVLAWGGAIATLTGCVFVHYWFTAGLPRSRVYIRNPF